MKRSDGLIVFEHLSSPSRSTVGEKENIKANASDFENSAPFVSSNAKLLLKSRLTFGLFKQYQD